MMNSLLLGCYKGLYWLNKPILYEKKCDFFFLIAEDIINTAIGSDNLQSEAGTDQLSHIPNWSVSAPFHQRNSREIRGAPSHACWLTGSGVRHAGIAGLAGQTPCWSGEEGQVSTRSDCLPPLGPATPPAPERLQTALPFLLRWFCHLSAPVTDAKSCSLPGFVAEEAIKNRIVPYIMKHALLGTARCGQLGSGWDLQGWRPLILLCCYGLLTRNTDTPGLSLPAPRRPSHSWSDQLLTLSKSPQLLSTRTRRA